MDMKPFHTLLSALIASVLVISTEIRVTQAQTLSWDAYMRSLQTLVAHSWTQMNRIWPGSNYTDLVLIATNGQRAWEITPTRLQELNYASVKNRFGGMFTFSVWKGRPAIILTVTEDDLVSDPNYLVPYKFIIATHEMFHHQVQRQWQSYGELANGARETPFPTDPTPRVLRQHLFLALINAYCFPDRRQQFLRAAAYWQQRWRQEFPQERGAIRTIDIIEGTARYTDFLAEVYSVIGFNVSPKAFRQATIPLLQKREANQPSYQVDLESYKLGMIAGLLADEMGIEWKTAAEKGTPPVDTVLAGIPPVEQPISEAVQHQIVTAINRENRTLAPQIEPLLAQMLNPNAVVLVIPEITMVGSLETSGFYTSPRLRGKHSIAPEFSAQYQLGSGKATFANSNVLFASAPACGIPNALLVPLNPADVSVTENRFEINLPTLQAKFEGFQVKDQRDRTFICFGSHN